MMVKIRILDDEKQRREKFVEEVSSAGLSTSDYDIDLLEPHALEASFHEMRKRQDAFRDKGYWESSKKIPLDEVDVLIVDKELREFFGEIGIFTDADQMAYMARSFSACGLIIVMNRISQNPFDLTLTLSYEGQFESFSDLEIGERQLSSKALWGTGKEEFHPWYWPTIPAWLEDFEKRIQDTEEALRKNVSILDFFGLADYRDWISRNVLQFLGNENDPTFQGFLKNNLFAFPRKDGNVIDNMDEVSGATITNVSRLVTARLSKWLEWKMLPGMDILVDAPHLVSRFPSLLDGNHENLDIWNATTVQHVRCVPHLRDALLEEHAFLRPHWLSRPTWYWRKVMNDENIPDVREPWDIEDVPFVFCEDTSSFVQEDEAKPFRAVVESVFVDRYIRRLPGVDYLPVQRLAL